MKLIAPTLILMSIGISPVQADVLLLDAISQAPANSSGGVIRPHGGERMAQVVSRFGEPESIKDAVGDPPITRWVYPRYTVYFEYESVIDVVVHRQ